MPTGPAVGSSTAGSSKTLDKALTLLRFVVMRGEALALTDVARETGLPKPTLHRLLGVLAAHGLVRLDRDGRYHPGPILLVYGTAYLGSTDLRRESLDLLAELMSATGETAHLGVLQPPHVVYVEKVESPRAVRMHSTIGGLSPIHSTGLGKAMLAHSNPGSIEVELRRPLERRTSATITDPAALRDELAAVRSRGYAIDDIENEEGIRCVAAPVFDHQGEMIGGISVAGPDTRMTPETAQEIAPLVVDVAVRLSRRLGYAGTLPATSPQRCG
jgi:DNA-binding IclR family transcriptional regulator